MTRSLRFSIPFFAASLAVFAQFKEIGPAPYTPSVARQKVDALLAKVEPANAGETYKTLNGLLVWYRDLIDDELIAAWRQDNKPNLTELIEKLADPRLAAGIVEVSWREQREIAFSPAYEPLLEKLMYRYPDSAKPFLDDLLGTPSPALSAPEAEAVCRILLHMPDIRTWRKDALRILPHYRAAAEQLLAQDLSATDDRTKSEARYWMQDLKFSSSAPPQSASSRKGVVLTPLDPALVDHTMASRNSNTPAIIDFVNRSGRDVDLYWIDFKGNRSAPPAHIASGASFSSATFLTHPFLVVASGTGGTAEKDTGLRLAGFQAQTPNTNPRDPSIRDTAIITGPNQVTSAAPGAKNSDGVYTVGSGVSVPTVLQKVDPEYSDPARKAKIQGDVLIACIIQPNGTASNIQVARSLGFGLDEQAVKAIRKWKFNPAKKDGVAVPSRVTINVHFNLLDRPPANNIPADMPSPHPFTLRRPDSDPAPAYSGQSLTGALRAIGKKDLVLQTASGKLLRFRLTLKTEFHSPDGTPYRDSLLNPGDSLQIFADRDDLETATYIVFLKPGTTPVPASNAPISPPSESDFSAK